MKEVPKNEPDTKAIDDAVLLAKRKYMRDYYARNKARYKGYKEKFWLKEACKQV